MGTTTTSTTTTRSAFLYLSLALLFLPGTNQTPPIDGDTAVEYLIKYGYMTHGGDTREALMAMQVELGIPVTGIFDIETQDLMNKPRCEITHRTNTSPHRRVKRFKLFGFQWRKQALTYTIRQFGGIYTPDLPNNLVEYTLSVAFQEWSRATPLTFTRLGTNLRGDIELSFQRRSHDDIYPFDGPGGTLAHALVPDQGPFYFVRIHFDEDERWTYHGRGQNREISLLQIALHEIGHALGLDHTTERDAIMYSLYTYKTFASLTDDDKLGAQTLYGHNPNIGPVRTTTTTTTTTTRSPMTRPTTTSTTTPRPRTSSTTYSTSRTWRQPDPATTRSPVTYQTTVRTPLYTIPFFTQYITRRFTNFQGTTWAPGVFNTQRFTNGPNNAGTTRGPARQDNPNVRSWVTSRTTRPPRLARAASFVMVESIAAKKSADTAQIPSFCSGDIVIDAVFSLEDIKTTYIFQGDVYYMMVEDIPAPGYPRRINETFPDVGSSVDAALSMRETSSEGDVETVIYLFKGTSVYKFDTTFDPVWPGDRSRHISEHFQGIPSDIDSAFYYKQSKAIYFFKGTSYYRLSQYLSTSDSKLVVDEGYPQPISKWNLPPQVSQVDAVFTWQRNFRTYIFSGTQYYRLDDDQSAVDTQTFLPYPRSTRMWWLGCYSIAPLGDDTSGITCRPEIEALDIYSINKTPKGSEIVHRKYRECIIIPNQVHSRLPVPDTLDSGCSKLKTKTVLFVLLICIHMLYQQDTLSS